MSNKILRVISIFGAVLFCLICSPQIFGQNKQNNNSSGYAEVNGGRIYYETAGKGEKTLVFIHGGLVDSRLWDDQFGEFAKNYRVVRYDIRRRGRTPPPIAPYSPVEDLYQLLKFLKIEKTTLVGLSMGGMISTDFAIEHPEMVERLVLAGAGLRGFPGKTSDATLKIYETASAAAPEKGAELLLGLELFAALKNKPKARARLLRLLTDNHKSWSVNDPQNYIFAAPPSIQNLDKISVPTLVIVGDLDHPDLLAIGRVLAEKIPNSELVIMKDASHHPNLEKPKEFNGILRKFLKNKSQ